MGGTRKVHKPGSESHTGTEDTASKSPASFGVTGKGQAHIFISLPRGPSCHLHPAHLDHKGPPPMALALVSSPVPPEDSHSSCGVQTLCLASYLLTALTLSHSLGPGHTPGETCPIKGVRSPSGVGVQACSPPQPGGIPTGCFPGAFSNSPLALHNARWGQRFSEHHPQPGRKRRELTFGDDPLRHACEGHWDKRSHSSSRNKKPPACTSNQT